MGELKPVDHVNFDTNLQNFLTLASNTLTLQDEYDFCLLENPLSWSFPADSQRLPFPRILWRFRIAPLLTKEWTGKVKLKAVLCWEYSAHRKEWWVTYNCLVVHKGEGFVAFFESSAWETCMAKLLINFWCQGLKSSERCCCWSQTAIAGIKKDSIIQGYMTFLQAFFFPPEKTGMKQQIIPWDVSERHEESLIQWVLWEQILDVF